MSHFSSRTALDALLAPQPWTEDDAPCYTKGYILSIAAMVCLTFIFVLYAFMVKMKNERRDRKSKQGQFDYMVNREGGGCGYQAVSVILIIPISRTKLSGIQSD